MQAQQGAGSEEDEISGLGLGLGHILKKFIWKEILHPFSNLLMWPNSTCLECNSLDPYHQTGKVFTCGTELFSFLSKALVASYKHKRKELVTDGDQVVCVPSQ